MSEGVQQFGNISLGSRSGTSQGQLKLTPAGFSWKKTGGGAGKTVELPLKDIENFIWTKVSRGCQLGVKRKSGATVNFTGFRDQDLEQLRQVTNANNKTIEEKELSMTGRNWGEAIIDGSTLVFNVAGKPALRIPLTDVGQVQKGKDEVMLEFPADDAAGGDHEDALFEMSFHIPKENDRFGTGDESTSAAEVGTACSECFLSVLLSNHRCVVEVFQTRQDGFCSTAGHDLISSACTHAASVVPAPLAIIQLGNVPDLLCSLNTNHS